jgi:hypothetical protein
MTSWPWVSASLATKTLHKKRPRLVPILDNQAIFGAYMNPRWPEQRSSMETIKATVRILEALEWIFYDLTRADNAEAWTELDRAGAHAHRAVRLRLVDLLPPSGTRAAAKTGRGARVTAKRPSLKSRWPHDPVRLGIEYHDSLLSEETLGVRVGRCEQFADGRHRIAAGLDW